MDLKREGKRIAHVRSFEEYQAGAVTTAIYPPGSVTYLVLGLNGEAGEVAEIVKRHIRSGNPLSQDDIERLALELGDCLWYLANLCEELGLELSVVAAKNLAKLQSRQERSLLEGRGSDR